MAAASQRTAGARFAPLGFGIAFLCGAVCLSPAFAQPAGVLSATSERLSAPFPADAFPDRSSNPQSKPAPEAVSVDFLRHPLQAKAKRMLQRALESMNAGDHAAAITQLEAVLAKFPDAAAYTQSILGVEYIKVERFRDAVGSFEQAVSLLPHDAMTHYNFALSLACAGDYRRAEREVRRSLELDPNSADARELLGVLADRKPPAVAQTAAAR